MSLSSSSSSTSRMKGLALATVAGIRDRATCERSRDVTRARLIFGEIPPQAVRDGPQEVRRRSIERNVVEPEVEDGVRVEVEVDGVEGARVGAHLALLLPEVALAEPRERDPELRPGRRQRQVDAGRVV